ncbi:MAG: hybrid sensor histidine kinase/response regulator [Desulfovibrio sp. S3730MH75]|nr:MAG: hybrid sensor histidine kinase/response regulator [Desulfovibrio sp. S3730MH75]
MKDSLRLKTSIGTFLILAIFFIFLGYYIIDSQKKLLEENLYEHGNNIASLTARSCAEYLPRFSYFLIEDLALSVEKSSQVAFCEIYDQDEKSILQSGNIISPNHKAKKTAHYNDNIMVVAYPIMSGEETLGQVEIGLTLDQVRQDIKAKTINLLLIFIGCMLCTIIALDGFFREIVLTPLSILDKNTRKIANREFVTANVGSRMDEIGRLALNFNYMSKNLESLYKNLEVKVQERTHELETTNEKLVIAIAKSEAMAVEAEKGAIAKSQFLAAMSHEIRTPMNSILGMAEILDDSGLDGEQQRFIDILQESGEALLHLINDILDLSKIEAGQVAFEHEKIDLDHLIGRAFKVSSLAGQSKGLELAYSIKSNVPSKVLGDPARLMQIFVNLIGNAIKFTERGFVVLEVSLSENRSIELGNKVGIHFEIKDSGIGIEPDKIDSIFDRFTQEDSSTTRQYGGTGLGLSICKSLCEAMTGSIRMESAKGFGSSVHIDIPFARNDVVYSRDSALKNQSILLINDQDYSRETFAIRVSTIARKVDKAHNFELGKILINEKSQEDLSYDLIIIRDNLHGWEWEKTVSSLIKLGVKEEKIILLANVEHDHIDDSFKGHVLLKPLTIFDLEKVVREVNFTVNTASKPAPGNQTAHISTKPLNILLVEDNKANCLLIELFFRKLPHRLTTVNNGQEGLDERTKNTYDVILMDIEMPVMDGYEATMGIRQWEMEHQEKPTKIIALTAHALTEVKDKILSAGCDCFLTKPITKAKLVTTISNLFSK